MSEQLQIAVAAGILGALSAVLGAVVQGTMAARQERLRRLRDETRDAYSRYLTFSTYSAYAQFMSTLVRRLDDKPTAKPDEALKWAMIEYIDISRTYKDVFTSLSLVASPQIMAVIRKEYDNFNNVLSKTHTAANDALSRLSHGELMATISETFDQGLDTAKALNSIVQARDTVVREMRKELGFKG